MHAQWRFSLGKQRLLCLIGALCGLLQPGYSQDTTGLQDPVSFRRISPGWHTDNMLGRLSISIPVAQMPGEVSFPIKVNIDGSQSRLTGINSNSTSKHITSAWTLGFGPSPYGQSVGILEDGTVFSNRDLSGNITGFTAKSADVSKLFSTYGLPNIALSETNCQVNSSGDLLVANVDSTYSFGTSYSQIIAGLTPSSATFGTLNGYSLWIDKNRLRVLAKCNNILYPILIADRYNHYVTMAWSRIVETPNLPNTALTITKVALYNQRQQGIVLRMLEAKSCVKPGAIVLWIGDPAPLDDLARLDCVGFSAPSVLLSGYSTPSSGTYYGNAGRPTVIQIGRPDNLQQPSWSGAHGAVSAQPSTIASSSSVSPRTWSLVYDSDLKEIASIIEPTGIRNDLWYSSYAFYSGNASSIFLLNKFEVRGVNKVVQTDQSGKSSSIRRLTWQRSLPDAGDNFMASKVVLSDWWGSSSSSTDRYEQFYYGDPSSQTSSVNNQVDFYNGFANKWILNSSTDSTEWARVERTSQGVTSGVQTGNGFNNTISVLRSSVTTRKNEAITGSQVSYADSTCLQPSEESLFTNSNKISTKSYTYNSKWSMLETKQVATIATKRYNASSGSQLTPYLKIGMDWDTNTTPKLQLLSSYRISGNYKHGLSYTYDGQGRVATQSVNHVENGSSLSSPNTVTITYDSTTTGLPINWSNAYQDSGGINSTITKTQGDFDASLRPQSSTDERSVTTQTTFDLYGRPTSISKDGDAPISISYPDEWTRITTQASKTTTEYFDGFGRLIEQDLPDGRVIVPTYDIHGRVINTTETTSDGKTRSSSTTYDLLGRVTSETGITGKKITYAYTTDGVNNIITKTVDTSITPAGQTPISSLVTIIKKDPFGQAISITAPNGDITSNIYDGQGNKTSITITPAQGGQSQARTFTFDALGRMSSKVEPETGTQNFSNFNALNQPQTITEVGTGLDPINPTLSRSRSLSYDGLGRLRAQSGGGSTEMFTYTGALLTEATRSMGNDVVDQLFSYDGPGKRMSQETTNGSVLGAW